MHASRLIAVTSALTLCVVLGACAPAPPPEFPGKLYFGAGNYLARLALRNGSTDIVASIGDAEILEISPKDGRRILLNVFGPVNKKDSHRLVLFDLETRQQLTFFEGRFGRYLRDGETLVYDDGARIWATWKRVNYWEKVEVAQHPFNASVRIVPVADNAFLYSIGREDEAPLYLFDTAQGQSTELSKLATVCGLSGALWIEDRSELLCRPAVATDAGPAYVFAGLDGKVSSSLQLPENKRFHALAYMHDRNALVFSESWKTWLSSRQQWAVWVYAIDDAAAHRILEHQYLGRSVIYQPE